MEQIAGLVVAFIFGLLGGWVTSNWRWVRWNRARKAQRPTPSPYSADSGEAGR